MSKLHQFQNCLSTTNFLSNKEQLSTKGGIRYLTDSQQEFEQMVEKLNQSGIEFMFEHGPKGWCIDW